MPLQNNITKHLVIKPKPWFWFILFLTAAAVSIIMLTTLLTGNKRPLAPQPMWEKNISSQEQNIPSNKILIVVLTNYVNENGVLNPVTLDVVAQFGEEILSLRQEHEKTPQLIATDFFAPNNISIPIPGNLGTVEFMPLFNNLPETDAQIDKISQTINQNPLAQNILLSENKKALALYLPLLENGYTPFIIKSLTQKLRKSADKESKIFFTGLPAAEEAFFNKIKVKILIYFLGIGCLIVLVSYLTVFPSLISLFPLIPAACSALCIHSLLIITNFPAGTLGFFTPPATACLSFFYSMLILFSFQQSFGYEKNNTEEPLANKAIEKTFFPLATILLAIGSGFFIFLFSSTSELRFFGILLVVAVLTALFFSPVCITALLSYTNKPADLFVDQKIKFPQVDLLLGNLTQRLIDVSERKTALLLIICSVFLSTGGLGTVLYAINNKQAQWPMDGHQIEQANRVVNKHFAGSFQLVLELSGLENTLDVDTAAKWLTTELKAPLAPISPIRLTIKKDIQDTITISETSIAFANQLETIWQQRVQKISLGNDIQLDLWSDAIDTLTLLQNQENMFLRPDSLHYIEKLQADMLEKTEAFKIVSMTDIVKMMHQAIFESAPERYTIPETTGSVRQCLDAFKNSKPTDYLYRFVNNDATKARIHFYLKNNDNTSIQKLIEKVEYFLEDTPPPVSLQYNWAGSLYDNMRAHKTLKTSMLLWTSAAFIVVICLLGLISRSITISMVIGGVGLCTLIPVIGICGVIGLGDGAYQNVFIPAATIISLIFPIFFIQTSRVTARNYGNWFNSDTFCQQPYIRSIQWGSFFLLLSLTPLLFFSDSVFPSLGGILILTTIATNLTLFICIPIALNKFQKKILSYELTEYAKLEALSKADNQNNKQAEDNEKDDNDQEVKESEKEVTPESKKPPKEKNLFDIPSSEQNSNA